MLLGAGVMACGGAREANPTASSTREPGSSADVGAGAAATGACGLLTVEDVVSAGLTVVSGPAPADAAPGDECIFVLTTVQGSVVSGRLTVELFSDEQGEAITRGLFGDSVPLDSIGTEAWTSRQQGLAAARLPDRRVVLVQLAAMGSEDPSATLVTLLTAAVGRA